MNKITRKEVFSLIEQIEREEKMRYPKHDEPPVRQGKEEKLNDNGKGD